MPKTIAVPKVPQRAYDPTRAPSSLLLSQVHQLQAAVIDAIDSEGEAALCIRTLTRLLEDLRPQIVPSAHKDSRTVRRRTRTRRSTATRRQQTGASRRTSRSRTVKKR